MYSTLSMAAYRQAYAAATKDNKNQHSPILFPPPAGLYSAYLLVDESASTSSCWGFCKNNPRELPFPQDKCLTIQHTTSDGQFSHTVSDKVYFIPVLGLPISSNCYYVVRAEGKHMGLVETGCSEEDMATICYCRCVKDIRPRPLQPTNSHQRMRIIPSSKYEFTSKCMASNGFPPHFLGRDGWRVTPKDMRGNRSRLAHVGGENAELRAQLPPFDFSLLQRRPPIVRVGEWYCPFIYITELGNRLKEPKIQFVECPFYKMELEKFWEEIYSTQCMRGKDVDVDTTLKVEESLLFGEEVTEEIRDNDGSVLFKGARKQWGQVAGVKLSWPIIAKMKGDQDRYGLERGRRNVRVKKSFRGSGMEVTFACYVVVERYVLKRMDGSIALTYSFRNSNQIQEKWELEVSGTAQSSKRNFFPNPFDNTQ